MNIIFAISLSLLATEAPSLERASIHSTQTAFSLGIAALSFGALKLQGSHFGASECRWCRAPKFETDLTQKLHWSNDSHANKLSHLTGYVLIPIGSLAMLSFDGRSRTQTFESSAIVLESVLWTGVFAELMKGQIARRRPTINGVTPTGKDFGFPSGHSSIAFATATSVATVATMENSSMAPWLWGYGLGFATLTAYFRMAAGKHYFTDTLAGAGLGALIGFAVPTLLHRPEKRDSKKTSNFDWFISPEASGLSLSFAWK